jgi:hypothetical protein
VQHQPLEQYFVGALSRLILVQHHRIVGVSADWPQHLTVLYRYKVQQQRYRRRSFQWLRYTPDFVSCIAGHFWKYNLRIHHKKGYFYDVAKISLFL